ncbi:MAG: hypothetical protein NT067_06045 [Candidatus Diapherotrites archaeon]|nr:hypothetical protein [Candidatus Diapherotrites archaeon]
MKKMKIGRKAYRDSGKLAGRWPFEKAEEGGRKPKVFVARRLGMTYNLKIGTAASYAPMMAVMRRIFRQDFRGKKVLELGPGVPVMLEELKRRGAIVYGLDKDPRRDYATGIRIEQGVVENLGRHFLDSQGKLERVNVVIAKNVFEPTQMASVQALEPPTKEKLEEMRASNEGSAKALVGGIADRYSISEMEVERVLPTEKRRADAAKEVLGIFKAVEERLLAGGHFIIQTTGESVASYHFLEPLLRDAGFEAEMRTVYEREPERELSIFGTPSGNPKTGNPISIFIARKPLA